MLLVRWHSRWHGPLPIPNHLQNLLRSLGAAIGLIALVLIIRLRLPEGGLDWLCLGLSLVGIIVFIVSVVGIIIGSDWLRWGCRKSGPAEVWKRTAGHRRLLLLLKRSRSLAGSVDGGLNRSTWH